MLHDLVVLITDAPGDRQALATAIELASRHRAHLSVLVAGAYGHARWRELVLGGVTRELLATCPVPMLFSH